MDATEQHIRTQSEPATPRAYDPNKLDPRDAAARELDDNSDGIDWDEIIATTQDDWEARRFDFDSAAYPTEEAGRAALERWMNDIVREVLDETAAARSHDAPCP
jgi:hypothetical protein